MRIFQKQGDREPSNASADQLVQKTHWWRPRSARTAALWLSLYLLLTANWPLWSALLGQGRGVPWVALISMGLLVFIGTAALFTLTAWTRGMKPVWMVLVLVAAAVQYYMVAYRIVIDPSMIANIVQTDTKEARDLLNWRMVLSIVAVAAPAGLWLWGLRLAPQKWWSQLWRNALMLIGLIVAAALVVLSFSRELVPLMRNHTQLRYMMNPLASVYSAGAHFLRPVFTRKMRFLPITAGTALGPSYGHTAKPPMFVLVVGETGRADHFSLNGYGRDTNPELAKRGVLSFTDVHSCGTNTLASVPCMFSHLGKVGYEGRKDNYENLLDVLQAAGLAVFWLDNQAGCKGVCDRVPHAAANDPAQVAAHPQLCQGDECLDEIMLQGLDARLAALPPERLAKGVVIVMHQMGSHGPAYYKRSAPSEKHFMPECTTNTLSECGQQALLNAYDNSIVATDKMLAGTIDWLKTQSPRFDTAMLYLSDHGESLGEYGLFLHGLPYNMAPEVQKHVPLVMWFSPGWQSERALRSDCLQAQRTAALTHDNLYHTVLGLMDVRNPTYTPKLDALAACRQE